MSENQYSENALSVRGKIPHPLVAIIGTRNPTIEASDAAFVVAKLLARSGIGVVSGLALGIDGSAHRGCLAGSGKTVAVLGHGFDLPVYPPQHAELAEMIEENGAVVSPFDAEVPVGRKTLLARNQWIAAMAQAVWVVQTGVPGGALAAAAQARRLGIPVLTTPWGDTRWRAGFNELVRLGAESVDVLTAAFRLEQLCMEEAPRLRQGVLAM